LTVGALALGFAMIIVIGGLITSTEVPILAWITDAVRADLLVTSGSAITGGGEHTPMAAALGDQLLGDPARPTGIQTVVPVRMVHIDYGQFRVLLCAVAMDRYRRQTRLTMTTGAPDAFHRLAAEPHNRLALVSDNFAIQHGIHAGDELELPTPRGRLRWQVIATVPDYSWNRGTIILDWEGYRHWFGDSLVDVFHVYLNEGTDPEAVRRDLHAQLGAEHDLVVLSNHEFRQYIKTMLNQFYGLLYANVLMALTVALLGVANTLAISVLQRRRELGLLRAVGATRRQVAGSVLAQAFLIGVLGLLLGTGLGLLLQTYVLRVLMVEEAGQFFAVLVPVTMTLVTMAFTLAAAQVAGGLPALRAAYQPISEAVAYE
jgi:putative ABC transport system permease protein